MAGALARGIKKIDLLGPGFSLTLGGEETLKTFAGSIFSLVYFGALVASIVVFTRAFFDKSDPKISMEGQTVLKGQKVEFGNLNMIPALFAYNKLSGIYFNSSEILKRFSFVMAIRKTEKGVSGDPYFDYSTVFRSVPCKEILQDSKKFNYLKGAQNFGKHAKRLDSDAVCLDITSPESISMHGNYSDIGSQTIIYNVLQCSGPDCAVAADDGTNVAFELVFPSFGVDLNSFQNPIKMEINPDDGNLFSDHALVKTEIFRPTVHNIYDEGQFLGQKIFKGSYITLDSKNPVYNERRKDFLTKNPIYDCNPMHIGNDYYCQGFFRVEFSNTVVSVDYTRRYKQVVDLLSEIGGISTLLLQVFTYVNTFYLFFARNSVVVSRFFPLLSSSKDSVANSEKMKEDIVSKIESSFDLERLFNELWCLKLLSNLFLDEQQMKLVSLSSLGSFISEGRKNTDHH